MKLVSNETKSNDDILSLTNSPSSGVRIDTLANWQKKGNQHNRPTDYSLINAPRYKQSPFPCKPNINKRFILW